MLGSVISWDFDVGAEYPVEKIKDALAFAGLPESSIEHLDLSRSFARAARKIADGATVDKVPGVRSVVTFQFSRKAVKNDGVTDEAHVEYVYSARVRLDCDTGAVTSDNPEIEEEARKALIACTENRTPGDLNKACKRMIAANAELYPINPRKGVCYFVPEAHKAYADKMEAFVRYLGASWFVLAVPENDGQTDLTVREALERGLRAEIEELAKTVDQFDASTRDGTLDKYVSHYQAAEARVEGYAAYLETKAGELLAKLREEKEVLKSKILAREEEKTVSA